MILVFVPSPPLPGFHIPLKRCRWMVRGQCPPVSSLLVPVQECRCRYLAQTDPHSFSVTTLKGGGRLNAPLSQSAGRKGSSPPAHGMVSCTAWGRRPFYYMINQPDDTSEKVGRAATVTAPGKLSRARIHTPRRVTTPSVRAAV